MRLPILPLALSVVSFFASAAQAQLTYTLPSATNSTSAVTDSFPTFGQTFTNFSSITAMTWTLNNTSGSTANASFTASVFEWTGTTTTGSALFTSALTPISVAGLADSGSQLSFNTSSMAALNPNTSYVLLLTKSAGGSASFVQNYVNTPQVSDFFSTGSMVNSNGSSYNVFNSGGTNFDLGLSVTGTFTPVPEPKTTAAIFAAIFVAMMVGRQIWLRRQAALRPVPVTV